MTDLTIFNFIHGFTGRWQELDVWMIFFAVWLQYWLAAGILIYIFWGKGADRRKNQLMVFSAAISAVVSRGIITEIIRLFYHRARPFLAQNFIPLTNHENSGSFPSGHMTLWWAVTAAAFYYNKKLGWALAVVSLIMGFSRVYVGVHWPSDILGGVLIGVFSGWLTAWYVEKKWKK